MSNASIHSEQKPESPAAGFTAEEQLAHEALWPVSAGQMFNAIRNGDESVAQRWIDEGGDLFLEQVGPSVIHSRPWPQLNAFAEMMAPATALNGKNWTDFLRKNEEKIRAMPGFDPDRASAQATRGPSKIPLAITARSATSLLHCAAASGNEFAVELLLHLGANPDVFRLSLEHYKLQKNDDPCPPLKVAESPGAAFALLRAGAITQGAPLWPPTAEYEMVEMGVATLKPQSAFEVFLRRRWRLHDLQTAMLLGADPLGNRNGPTGAAVLREAAKTPLSEDHWEWLAEVGATSEDFIRAIHGERAAPRQMLIWLDHACSSLRNEPERLASALERMRGWIGPELWERAWSMPVWPKPHAGAPATFRATDSLGRLRDVCSAVDAAYGENGESASLWEVVSAIESHAIAEKLGRCGPALDTERDWPVLGRATAAAAFVIAQERARVAGSGRIDRQKPINRSDNVFSLGVFDPEAALPPQGVPGEPQTLGELILDRAMAENRPFQMIAVATQLGDYDWAPDAIDRWTAAFEGSPDRAEQFAKAVATAQQRVLEKMLREGEEKRNAGAQENAKKNTPTATAQEPAQSKESVISAEKASAGARTIAPRRM